MTQDEAERRVRESEALRAITRDILSRVDLETVMERVSTSVRALLDASYSAVATVRENGETTWHALVGQRSDTWREAVFPAGRGTAGRVVAANAPVVIEGFPDNPDFPPDEFPLHSAEGMRSALGVPLRRPTGEAFGALVAGWREPRAVRPHDVELASALAQVAGIALENARLFEEAGRARREAEAANLAKSQFLANMSHEIRTPINAILGYTELLEMGLSGPLSDAQRQQLSRVRTSGQHLLGLVNEILDLARVESGQLRVARERIPLRASVAQALSLVAPQAAKRGVSLADTVLCDPRAEYCGDDDRVRQILVNLLGNAVKFTAAAGRVSVTCDAAGAAEAADDGAELEGSGPWLRVRVDDTGVGIAPEQLARVWEPFVQADASHTRQAGGTGLGLTISRRLARLMGGDVTARSTPGEGSSFTLWLPAATEAAAPARPSVTAVPGLAAVGRAVVDGAQRIVERLAARLRADPRTPLARDMEEAEVQDHMAVMLGDLGLSLAALEETGGEPGIMQDGSAIRRIIAQRHGAQRARLGWTEDALRREGELLRDEIDRELRALDAGREADAAAVLRRLVDEAEEVAVAALRDQPGVEGEAPESAGESAPSAAPS